MIQRALNVDSPTKGPQGSWIFIPNCFGIIPYPSLSTKRIKIEMGTQRHIERYPSRPDPIALKRKDMFALNRERVAQDHDQEEPRCTCSACGCPLDNLGACPKCLMQRVEIARLLRIKQRNQDLFRQIDRIVAKRW
jgi:hypothetical protein